MNTRPLLRSLSVKNRATAPVGMQSLRSGVFSMDGLEGYYEGYEASETGWNGAACPLFTKTVSDRICEALPKDVSMRYDHRTDSYVFRYLDTDETSTYTGLDRTTVDGVRHLYPIGAWEWLWYPEVVKRRRPIGFALYAKKSKRRARTIRKGTILAREGLKNVWDADFYKVLSRREGTIVLQKLKKKRVKTGNADAVASFMPSDEFETSRPFQTTVYAFKGAEYCILGGYVFIWNGQPVNMYDYGYHRDQETMFTTI